ncbi:MAG: CNNM domain-containing protein [Halorhabdus sp.]
MVEIALVGRLLAGVLLLFGNGYFVTIEFAMTRVRQFSEEAFQGSAGLRRAWEMTEELEIYLSGCQVGITICSVGLGVVAEPALAAIIDPLLKTTGLVGTVGGGGAGHSALSVLLSLAAINLLHVVVGEQAPTYLGIERTRLVAGYGAPLLYWWTRVLSPVIRLADWIAKGLLGLFGVTITRSWAEEEAAEGEEPESRGAVLSRMGSLLRGSGMPSERRQEVLNAIAIDRLEVEDIMIPRESIVAMSTDATIETNLERIRGTPHTRFPLVDASVDDPVGVVYVPALLDRLDELRAGELRLTDVAEPIMTVDPDRSVAGLIDAFQAEQQELAMVVDGDGTTVGLVTVTDAFEAIAGDVEDPLDIRAEEE